MQVAIASTDGETVNEHFGRAKKFFIFEINGTQKRLLMVREVTPLSTGDKEHSFNRERMADVLKLVKDCGLVYCTEIGKRPEKELAQMGIKALVGKTFINDIPG